MDCSTPGFPVYHQLLELTQTHAIQPSHPLSFPSPAFRVFSNESVLHIKWPKYWSFSFSISPSNECLGLISFRIDWFDLLAVQRTLKSLLQHHSLIASIVWCSAFFMVQFSYPYMSTGKTIALTRPTFVILVFFLHLLHKTIIIGLLLCIRICKINQCNFVLDSVKFINIYSLALYRHCASTMRVRKMSRTLDYS